MIKVEFKDFDRLAEKITTKKLDKVEKAVKTSTLSVEARAKKNLTNNKSVKTGHLRRSITHKFAYSSLIEGTVHTSNLKYAKWVEDGTRPHIIRPKKGKALYWQGASRPVKFVRHPGGKAKPYLVPALEKEKDNFIRNLRKAVNILE